MNSEASLIQMNLFCKCFFSMSSSCLVHLVPRVSFPRREAESVRKLLRLVSMTVFMDQFRPRDLLPFLMRVAEMANLLFMRIFATKTKNLHLSRVHFEDDCWYPMVLQKEISCLVDGIVFHGQTCPLVLQQSACDFLRLKQITSIQKRTALRIWRWTLNLIYPNIAFDWIGLSQNLQEFPRICFICIVVHFNQIPSGDLS